MQLPKKIFFYFKREIQKVKYLSDIKKPGQITTIQKEEGTAAPFAHFPQD